MPHRHHPQTSRRDFLKVSSALGAAVFAGTAPRINWGQERSANEVIRFACIGVDGKGSSDRDDAGRHGEIVALCDIDEERLRKASARYPDAKVYTDFRKMLDELHGSLDAVTVSTPDHTHAPAAVRAMRYGLHCFCQKPLTYSVAEARLMRELAAEKNLCTQMGNQGTATSGHREAIEIIRRGDIGAVTAVHIWTNRPIWPQGGGRPAGEQPVPEHVKWDLWLGPAPFRPYNDAYHPFKWRGWLDFGTGALGDMACHTMNMAVSALELYEPTSIEAMPDPDWKGEARGETFPKFCQIKYEFGKRGDMGPCTLTWYDGGQRPPQELCPDSPFKASGSLVIGEKGMIHSSSDYHSEFAILPKASFEGLKTPETVKSPGHFTEFAEAIKAGKPELALSNFANAGRLTETVLLGNVALRAGGKVEWDAVNLKVTNLDDANKFVRRTYREGWEV